MKLYIKQKALSWRDRFTVKDEWGNDRWYAQGEFFSWGRKLHIYDTAGQEVAFIRQKLISFLPRYFIETGGRVFSLKKEFTLFRHRFSLEGTNWKAKGNFWAHEYGIDSPAGPVMRMSKHWFTWGDSYEIDIPDPGNELLCLCAALAIDCMNADAASHSS